MRPDAPVIAVTLDFDDLPKFVHWKEMFRGVVAAGAVPVAVDCGKPRDDLESILSNVDGLMITGGVDINPALYGGSSDDPKVQRVNMHRDANELKALQIACNRELPVLAICRGAQLVNVALGGTLYADLKRDWIGSTGHWKSEEALVQVLHSVRVESGTCLAQLMGISGLVPVNSQHHQGIKDLAPEARASAMTEDGLVEAFEIGSRRIIAVQWHPEVLWRAEPHALSLLTRFAEQCTDGERCTIR